MSSKRITALTSDQAMAMLDVATIAWTWPLTLVAARLVLGHSTHGIADLLYPIAELICLYALGLYRRDVLVTTRKALGRASLAAGLGAITAAAAMTLLHLTFGFEAGPVQDQPRLFASAVASFLVSCTLARTAFSILRHKGAFRRRLLVVGAGRRAWDLAWMLRKESSTLNYEIAFVHEPALGEVDPRLADGSSGSIVHLGAGDILDAARRLGADQIVVAPDERRGMNIESLLRCKIAGFPVYQHLSFVEMEIRRLDLKRMELSWLLNSDGFYFGTIDRFLKRILDLAVSSVLLLAFVPFLLAAAVAIKLDDAGPVLYAQERVTRNGRIFRIYKLRTMRVDAEQQGAVWAASGDNRVTRVGAYLRRTRIDEMPQLFNVFRGDMSLVGPRPERPAFVRSLAEQIPLYHERHVVKAGLTGWAQVNYPYGASIDDARSKLSYDLYYVKNFSIRFDILVILQTIRVVFWPSGVH